MYQAGEGPIFRCACPDGCSLGWGWVHGLCQACYRTYLDRRKLGKVTVPVEAYRLRIPEDEPISWGVWERLGSQGRAKAKQRTKLGFPPLGAASIGMDLK